MPSCWQFLLSSLLLAGCGATAVAPPRAMAEIDPPARVTNERTRKPRPLVAPPPAYGNRVVERDHTAPTRSAVASPLGHAPEDVANSQPRRALSL
jgi:hypothetical protein